MIVMVSHRTTAQAHEGPLRQAGREIGAFFRRNKGPLAVADVIPALLTGFAVPGATASVVERIVFGGVGALFAPILLWAIGSLVLMPVLLRRQRDVARVERDQLRCKYEWQGLNYLEVRSLIRHHIGEGKRLLWRARLTRRSLGEVRSDAQAWQRSIEASYSRMEAWEKNWGDTFQDRKPIGRSGLTEWLKDKIDRLQSLA